jgi:hypothetical protein
MGGRCEKDAQATYHAQYLKTSQRILLFIPGISAPPLAKVAQSRHDKSSLVEAVVNPSSNLKGIALMRAKQGEVGERLAYHFN